MFYREKSVTDTGTNGFGLNHPTLLLYIIFMNFSIFRI